MQSSEQTETNLSMTDQQSEDQEKNIGGDSGVSPLEIMHSNTSFDWFAIGMVIVIAAIFAIAGRLNTQPASSLTPVAVLTATGCGLFVTALRKLRTSERAGLLEAGLGGLFLAILQFLVALTYPSVFSTISTYSDERLGFLTTWGLIALCSIIFSIVGAVLGHLAFAPLRPLPAKATSVSTAEGEGTLTIEERQEDTPEETVTQDTITVSGEDNSDETDTEENEESLPVPAPSHPQRTLINSIITVLLLGSAPTVVGFVFSAAFDFMITSYHFFTGPYPTLRLLSSLLPWQVPIQVSLNGPNQQVFLLWLLWRIPLFLGNPSIFDFQALEPLVFNGAALALLLLTLLEQSSEGKLQPVPTPWSVYLVLEALLGFILVLPANLWMARGLQGLLQIQQLNFVVQIRTLSLLDPLTFTLNLVTGPVVCLIIGILVRRFYQQRLKKQ